MYERPAVPKRVTIVDMMPMTAIGKIYKPALRLRAVEVKLAEMLADVEGLSVRGIEQGGKLTAVVSVASAYSPALEAQLRERLAAIAVPVEFVFTGT